MNAQFNSVTMKVGGVNGNARDIDASFDLTITRPSGLVVAFTIPVTVSVDATLAPDAVMTAALAELDAVLKQAAGS